MRRRLVVSSGKQTIAMLLSLVVTLPNLGCSFLQRPTQPVSIMATDPSALIYVNGAAVGTGAATVELARDQAHEVMARTADGRVGTAEAGSGREGFTPRSVHPHRWPLHDDRIRI